MAGRYTLSDLMRSRAQNSPAPALGGLSGLRHLAAQSALQSFAAPEEEPLPSEWWKKVPPHERDWWMNRLNAMPFADPNSFRDDNALMPNTPGALGDRMPAYDQEITQDWLSEQQRRWDMLGGRFAR